jgi:hypothetical protein
MADKPTTPIKRIDYTLEQAPPHDPAKKPFEPYGLQWQHQPISSFGPIFFWFVVFPAALLYPIGMLAYVGFVIYVLVAR